MVSLFVYLHLRQLGSCYLDLPAAAAPCATKYSSASSGDLHLYRDLAPPKAAFAYEFCNDCAFIVRQMLEQGSHPILAVKTARVGDFNGKTLSTLNTSLVNLDPDIPEAGALRTW